MKALAALVIVMGVLIVIGLVVVAVTVTSRLRGNAALGSIDLAIPAGCQVVETVPATDRLILRLGTGERCNQIIIVDMASGKLLGRLNLVPAMQ
jgi:hypothetical protein